MKINMQTSPGKTIRLNKNGKSSKETEKKLKIIKTGTYMHNQNRTIDKPYFVYIL